MIGAIRSVRMELPAWTSPSYAGTGVGEVGGVTVRPSGRRLASGRLPRGPKTGAGRASAWTSPACRSLVAAARPGGLQTSPVIVGIDSDGKVVISSRETAYKVGNLRRHPTAVRLHRRLLRPLDADRGARWRSRRCRSHGRADRLLPPHLRRAPRLGRLHGAMVEQRRVPIRLSIDHVSPDHAE